MATGHHVFLLDEDMENWLRREGVPLPPEPPPGRWPSPNELQSTLEELPGFRTTLTANTEGGWDAEIVDALRGYEGWSATVWVHGIINPDVPQKFVFHKPQPELAILILERLSRFCGPFVLASDASVRPVVITPGCVAVEKARELTGSHCSVGSSTNGPGLPGHTDTSLVPG